MKLHYFYFKMLEYKFIIKQIQFDNWLKIYVQINV